MAGTPVIFNGTNYSVPAVKDKLWGPPLRALLISLAGNALAKSGGNFTLTADVNFGANFGLIAKYLKSTTANIAQSGVVRFANAEGISWRNFANNGDLGLIANVSNRLQFNGSEVGMVSDKLSAFAATTSAELASVISDETGNGSLVFGTGPTISNPLLSAGTRYSEIATPATPGAGILIVYPKSDRKLYILNSDGVETQVGSGSGSGAINYITNADFEATANGATPAGWLAYADAAGAIPIDGTGGSPNAAVTFLASNAAPVRGTMSAAFTKDANNRQGIGRSFDFSIAAPDRSKRCRLAIELDCSSNYVAGDLAFYFVNRTSGAIITPTTAAIPKLTNGSWEIFFDSQDTLDYRLCIHVATTSALAYTVKFDSFLVNGEKTGGGTAIVTEYASNSGSGGVAAGASYTTGQVTGETGSNFVSVNSATGSGSQTVYAVDFSDANQLTDKFILEYLRAGSFGWSPVAGSNLDYAEAGSNTSTQYYRFGFRAEVSSTSNRVEVVFGNGGARITGAEGTVGQLWSDYNSAGWKWRVRRERVLSVNTGAGTQPEYVYNTATSVSASDTTSFASGSQGALVQNITTALDRRVRISSPLQNGEVLGVQISFDQQKWFFTNATVRNPTTGNIEQHNAQNGVEYGLGRVAVVAGSNTDFDIRFGQYANSGTTFGGAGGSWSGTGGTSTYWRVVRYRPDSPVGYGMANANESGFYPAYNTVANKTTSTTGNSGVANVASITQNKKQYTRLGNFVTVSVNFTITSSAAGSTTFDIGLPFASNFLANAELTGGGGGVKTGTLAAIGVYVEGANTGGTRTARAYFTADAAGTWIMGATFMYEVV